ncbi:MAG: cytochrome c [Pseudomonadota bacterium]
MRWLQAIILSGVIGTSAFASVASSGEKPSPGWQGNVDYWQPQWMQRQLWGPGRMPKGMQVRLLRHWTYVNYGVPPTYQNARSDIKRSSTTILQGGQIYGQHCASCHGVNGLGNGEAGKSLLPSPALLSYMINRPISADEYLLWAISDGGMQFQTSMPAFKNKLTRNEIWKIIAYMRAGFRKQRQK